MENQWKNENNRPNVDIKIQSKYNTFEYFDFGGGFPIKYSLTYSFDYDYLVDSMIKTVKDLSTINEKQIVNIPEKIHINIINKGSLDFLSE